MEILKINPREFRVGNWVSPINPMQITEGNFNWVIEMGVKGIPLVPEAVGSRMNIARHDKTWIECFDDRLTFVDWIMGRPKVREGVFAMIVVDGEPVGEKYYYLHELQNLVFSLEGREIEPTIQAFKYCV